MRTLVLGFGLLTLCLLILFKVAEVQVVQGNARLEIVVAFAAIVFFFIGYYVNQKSTAKKIVAGSLLYETHQPVQTPNQEQLKKLGLTSRELEVLEKMALGLSNQEIGQALFLSESTIKSHVSNILLKMDVKNRILAVQQAKELKIIP
jgi:DNA-binding CsgD family transcriptional regulator